MTHRLADRIQDTTASYSGTGNVTMAGAAPTGMATANSVCTADGDTIDLVMEGGSQWEYTRFTRVSSGVYSRQNPPWSSSTGSQVTFTAGVKNITGDIGAFFAEHLNMVENTIASAATTDVGALKGLNAAISGTVTITSLGTAANKRRRLRFTGALILTHNATSLILPGAANLTTIAGDVGMFESDASGNWRCTEWTSMTYAPFAGKLIKCTVYPSAGSFTWTKSAGCKSVIAEVFGSGGSGGSAVAGTVGQAACAGGGGGGGYSMRRITAPGATETVTIGSGGAAAAPGAGNGNGGNTSSFGSWCSATGGTGGTGCSSGIDSTHVGGAGGSGGFGSGGDFNLAGENGGSSVFGTATNAQFYMSGKGGICCRGGAGGAGLTGQGTGNAGANGGGGGGGMSDHIFNTGAGQSGGAGGAGSAVIWEFE